MQWMGFAVMNDERFARHTTFYAKDRNQTRKRVHVFSEVLFRVCHLMLHRLWNHERGGRLTLSNQDLR